MISTQAFLKGDSVLDTHVHVAFYLSTNLSMQVISVLSGTAPATESFFSPFLNIIMVGMLWTPYWLAMSGFSSVLSL
uniref:Thioredoxin M-type n=1 Tax=Arundo donax TaxID=35708 RepID=A0A0A9FSI8_ARUDO